MTLERLTVQFRQEIAKLHNMSGLLMRDDSKLETFKAVEKQLKKVKKLAKQLKKASFPSNEALLEMYWSG